MSTFTKCDSCNKELPNGSPIHLSCGFGTTLDGEEYDFCSLEHLCVFCRRLEENKKPEYDEMVASEIEEAEIDDQL